MGKYPASKAQFDVCYVIDTNVLQMYLKHLKVSLGFIPISDNDSGG